MSKCTPRHKLPNFNLLCSIWRSETPLTNPADIINQKCELVFYAGPLITAGWSSPEIPAFVYLFLPRHSDLRNVICHAGNDRVEVPQGSRRFYEVTMVEDVAKGFANEFRVGVLLQIPGLGTWPEPIP